MTARLEKAIKQLPPQKLEDLADYAEFLAARAAPPATDAQPKFLNLDWIGAAAHLFPEHESGVEAQHAASQMRLEKLDRANRG